MKRTWTNEQLIIAVKNSITISDVARKLGLSCKGSHKIIKQYIQELELDTTHFMHSHIDILIYARKHRKSRSLTQIFVKNSKYSDVKYIKNYLIKSGALPYQCNICSISSWNNKKLSLQLDHINGNHSDNLIENLRLLCPNCHSQTETYCGKKNRSTKINYCNDCPSTIGVDAVRCKKCAAKLTHQNKTKIIWPPTSSLIQMVDQFGFKSVGQQLGVSDNCVRKRIKNHPTD